MILSDDSFFSLLIDSSFLSTFSILFSLLYSFLC